MGDPKKTKKKYRSPRFPWRSDVLKNELILVGEFGLRNKRELWIHKSTLSQFRSNARSLLGKAGSEKSKLQEELLGRLKHLGFLAPDASLYNVLDLTMESILERRLQTLVYRRELAKTIYQARQMVTHGHISILGKKVFSPGFIVPKDLEDSIDYSLTSPISNLEHPIRESMKSEIGGSEEAE